MDKKLNILVIGSGGREHAIVKKCQESPLSDKIIAAPGNGGMEQEVPCFPIAVEDTNAIIHIAKEESIDLVIIGPEIPLSLGLVDALESEGILAYGPNKAGAQLESSKSFCKDFFKRHSIPTAKYETFTEVEPAIQYINENKVPIVVKASGLAAGKGVIIAQTKGEAIEAIEAILIQKSFGDSGNEIVIEEYLEGEEVSIHAIVSNGTFLCLPPSQDHKRIGEGDTGLNTGGMGAYAPTSNVSQALQSEIEETIITPTIKGLLSDGINYSGTLYAGLMLTKSGPKILEYNVRFGDPETQVLLPLLQDDFLSLLYCSAKNDTLPTSINLSNHSCMTVVVASKGYPGSYPKGDIIQLPKDIPENATIIHAGTKLNQSKEIISNGGRVLNVTCNSEKIEDAANAIYSVCDSIKFQNKVYRRDIAYREINRKIAQ